MDLKVINLETALPQPGRAISLRTAFNESLLESLSYLVDNCEEILEESQFDQIKNYLGSLDPHQKVSSFLGVLNTALIDAIQKDDSERAKGLLLQIPQAPITPQQTIYMDFYELSEPLDELVLHAYTYTLPKARLDKVNPIPMTRQGLLAMELAFARGFEILEKISPELFEESQDLIEKIIFFNSPELKAGTSFDLLGVFYCGYEHKWDTLTDALDIITHEQAHHYVFLLNNIDLLIHNGEEHHTSPLRPESTRPLMGIYHAAFVMARICHVLDQALYKREIPQEEKEYCISQIWNYLGRYEVAYEVLTKHAQMTPLAAGLLESSRTMAHSLRNARVDMLPMHQAAAG